jgi:nucleotide-binding universal stress UspA family protein
MRNWLQNLLFSKCTTCTAAHWWEEALAGSVTKYLIDRSKLNVVVLH